MGMVSTSILVYVLHKMPGYWKESGEFSEYMELEIKCVSQFSVTVTKCFHDPSFAHSFRSVHLREAREQRKRTRKDSVPMSLSRAHLQ